MVRIGEPCGRVSSGVGQLSEGVREIFVYMGL